MTEHRSQVSRALQRADRGAASAERQLVQSARRHRQSGHLELAADALRRALVIRGGTASTWRMQGQLLVELHRASAAGEAFRAALALDPTDFDSLEMLYEVIHKDGSGGIHLIEADLIAALPAKPRKHLEAADMAALYGMAEAQEVLLRSPVHDAVATIKAVRYLYNASTPAHGDFPMHARLVASLTSSNEATAVEILQSLAPDGIPRLTLRRAIRRLLQRGRSLQARPIIKEYLRALPSDAWALSLLETRAMPADWKISETSQRLTDRGFTLPRKAAQPAYAADPAHALYLLHNSLPYNTAGYAARTHGLLSAMANKGWRIDGVTRPGYPYDTPAAVPTADTIPPIDDVENVRYRRLTSAPEAMPKHPLEPFIETYAARICELARTTRPFLLHGSSNHWNGLAVARAARTLGIPSVYEVRGLWELTRMSREPDWADSQHFRYMSRMETEAALAADRVLVITDALGTELRRRGVPSHKIEVLPNGVDAQRFKPIPPDYALLSQYGLAGRTVIGYIGSLLDYEGVDILLEAVNRIVVSTEKLKVMIIGDGDAADRLMRRSRELGLDQTVTFTGRVPHSDITRWYSVIDIFALPRRGLPVCEIVSPLKPFEIMAAGKALIASDVAALAEIVQDGRTGLLHRKDSPESLARKLEILLAEPEFRARLGEEARRWVVAERDWGQLSSKLALLYEQFGGSAGSVE